MENSILAYSTLYIAGETKKDAYGFHFDWRTETKW
jgi:hypothetical protein